MSESERGANRSELATMRSPLVWTLLGVVIERPGHGYELAQRFKQVYDDTLMLSDRKNVYRLLETLISQELIEQTAPDEDQEPAPNRLPKPHYRATTRGKRTYEEWLLGQLQQEFDHQRLFARQLAMLEPEKALEVLDRYEHEYLEEDDEKPIKASDGKEHIAEQLSHEDMRLKLGATISWLRYARRELKLTIQERTKQP